LDRLDDPKWQEEDPCLDFGPAALPYFVGAFNRPNIPAEQRSRLIRAIWQFRVPQALPTLAAALDDPCDDVWKDALDGLVTIGGVEAQQILQAARLKAGQLPQVDKLEWIDEAFEQVVERLGHQ
jgi:HEAT repeat protein